jgi:hypothetical protein
MIGKIGVAGFLTTSLLASRALGSEWNFVEADVFKNNLAKGEQMLVAFVAPEE